MEGGYHPPLPVSGAAQASARLTMLWPRRLSTPLDASRRLSTPLDPSATNGGTHRRTAEQTCLRRSATVSMASQIPCGERRRPSFTPSVAIQSHMWETAWTHNRPAARCRSTWHVGAERCGGRKLRR